MGALGAILWAEKALSKGSPADSPPAGPPDSPGTPRRTPRTGVAHGEGVEGRGRAWSEMIGHRLLTAPGVI